MLVLGHNFRREVALLVVLAWAAWPMTLESSCVYDVLSLVRII
jgi:hypothetical protein